MGDRVCVAVRVRPLNRREIDLESKVIVDMEENQTILQHPKWAAKLAKNSKESITKYEPKTFAFDHCFWSIDEHNTEKFAGQQKVFECVGSAILARAFEGYNACILAYGQTGSGKSYTMMGSHGQQGIIPRFCESLFGKIEQSLGSGVSFRVLVSYMEIYNEKVRDLLEPGSKHNLTVREHTVLGPYVDGLLQLAVKSYQEVECLLVEGTKSRTVAATSMNSESSRSHAVFTLTLVRTQVDPQSGTVSERVSRVSLVDLAGSERASKTGSIGERLREGGNINRSLTTLGLVVKSLAEKSGKHHAAKFVPYRDSVLTWLLKDSLGGNSKTVMLALVSPAADNYEESLSTLRYADSAKRIVNHAVVNEDPNSRIIRELRKEIEELQARLSRAEVLKAPNLKERLDQSERLMTNMCKTWEEQLQETERIQRERQGALEAMGIHVEISGIKVDTSRCFLVNLNADPSLNELLVYYLKEHTRVGRTDGGRSDGGRVSGPDIQLDGVGIMPDHCLLDVDHQSRVYVTPMDGARTCINGVTISGRTRAKHGDRILWGNNHFFRLNCPKDANDSAEALTDARPKQLANYELAQEELMQQEMATNPIHGALEHMEKQLNGQAASPPALLSPSADDNDSSAALWDSFDSGLCPADQTRSPPLLHGNTSLSDSAKVSITMQSRSKGIDVRNENLVGMASHRRKKRDGRRAVDAQRLAQLRRDLYRAHCLAREANMLAKSVPSCDVAYEVSLQIPASELRPNLRQLRNGLACRPAIVARRRGQADQKQLFTADDFECRLVAMRDACLGSRTAIPPESGDTDSSPFGVSNAWHDLIGVANVFLDALFYDASLDHWAVIVSQYGEVAGRLHVTLSKKGDRLDPMSDDEIDGAISDSDLPPSASTAAASKKITIRVAIEEAKDLPPALANFVFCQYKLWDDENLITVPPAMTDPSDDDDIESVRSPDRSSVNFEHAKEFVFSVTEEFVDYISSGSALSIEVYGHRAAAAAVSGATAPSAARVQPRSPPGSMSTLAARWAEVTRRVRLHVQILELGDAGVYEPVELRQRPDVPCGGVFQLRQGYSRRLRVGSVCLSDGDGGQLPLASLAIECVCIGGICLRSQQQRGLDSYHEQGLELLRDRWRAALDRRRAYLNGKMALTETGRDPSGAGDGAADSETQGSLRDEWDELISEMDAVCSPAAGSGVPGAPMPSSRLAVSGSSSEQHVPVVFLDLKADDADRDSSLELFDSVSDDGSEGHGCSRAIGEHWLLDKEEGTTFIQLPLVQRSDSGVSASTAVASWDSTLHESVHLNMTTLPNERVYLTVKAYLRLGVHPEPCTVVLRKRICVSMYRKASLSDKLRRSVGTPRSSPLAANRGSLSHPHTCSDGSCSVAFDIISCVPKALCELESGEALAKLAAAGDGCTQAPPSVPSGIDALQGSIGEGSSATANGETYIEQYLRSIAAIESVILADKAGQEAAIKESLRAAGRPLRRFGSSPSVSTVDKSSRYLFSPRGEAVTPPLLQSRLAMSVKDLSNSRSPRNHGTMTSEGRFLRQTFATADNLTSLPSYTEAHTDYRAGERTPEAPKSTSTPRGRGATMVPSSASSSSPAIKSLTLMTPSRPAAAARLTFLSCVGIEPSSGDDDDDAYMPSSSAAAVTRGHATPRDPLPRLQSLPEAVTAEPRASAAANDWEKSTDEPATDAMAATLPHPRAALIRPATAAAAVLELQSGTATATDMPNCREHCSAAGDPTGSVQQPPSSSPLHGGDSRTEEREAAEAAAPCTRLSDVAAAAVSFELATSDDVGAGTMTQRPSGSDKSSVSDQSRVDDDLSAGGCVPAARSAAPATGRAFAGGAAASAPIAATVEPTALLPRESQVILQQRETAAAGSTAARRAEANSAVTAAAAAPAAAVAAAAAQAPAAAPVASAPLPSRLELLSDPYSLSALDRLEAAESSDDNASDSFGSDDDQPLTSRGRAQAGAGASSHVVSGHGAGFAMVKSGHLLRSPGADNSDSSDDSSECSFGSTADLMTSGDDVLPPWLKRGTGVIVLSTRGKPPRTGTVKLIGETVIAPGTWIGVQFQEPVGKNDGSVRGVRYFRCPPRHGIFVRPDRVLANRKDMQHEADDGRPHITKPARAPPGASSDDLLQLADTVRAAANFSVVTSTQGSAVDAAAASAAATTGGKEPPASKLLSMPAGASGGGTASAALWVPLAIPCTSGQAASAERAPLQTATAATFASARVSASAGSTSARLVESAAAAAAESSCSSRSAPHAEPTSGHPMPTARDALTTGSTAAAASPPTTTTAAAPPPAVTAPPRPVTAASPPTVTAAPPHVTAPLHPPVVTAAAPPPPVTAAAPPPPVTAAAAPPPVTAAAAPLLPLFAAAAPPSLPLVTAGAAPPPTTAASAPLPLFTAAAAPPPSVTAARAQAAATPPAVPAAAPHPTRAAIPAAAASTFVPVRSVDVAGLAVPAEVNAAAAGAALSPDQRVRHANAAVPPPAGSALASVSRAEPAAGAAAAPVPPAAHPPLLPAPALQSASAVAGAPPKPPRSQAAAIAPSALANEPRASLTLSPPRSGSQGHLQATSPSSVNEEPHVHRKSSLKVKIPSFMKPTSSSSTKKK